MFKTELSTREVAAIIERSPTMVRKYVVDGKLTVIRRPGSPNVYTFSEDDVLDFMIKREAEQLAAKNNGDK